MDSIDMFSPFGPRPFETGGCVQRWWTFYPNRNRRAPEIRNAAAIYRPVWQMRQSTIAQAVGGALPLLYIVGDHARGLHRGLAELGVAGNLALDALAFGMQQVAQALELSDQILDLGERGAGDALDQRVDVGDGGFRARIERRRVGGSRC